MSRMTMRERILAVVQRREMDRVPFVMYDGLLPVADVQNYLGRERIGLMRWCRVHRIEHPHCDTETQEYYIGDSKWCRNIIHTPKGDIYEERAFEKAYNSSSIRKHYVQTARDHEIFWAYLEDGIILENYDQFYQDQADLGDDGVPLVAVERSPYQQLWVQWVGIDMLGFHFADHPDHVQHTIELLRQQAYKIFEIAQRSPAPFVDFPDNITAPTIGPRRFREFCVPMYNALADRLAERDAIVFVHMDGDLKPLWQAITESKVRGMDSLAPAPDNDTTVGQAATMWPEMRLFVNFPSSQHLLPAEGVRAQADQILAEAGHTGRLQIQLSENVPYGVWRTSLPAIVEAIEAFGKP
jgi:hypothetical protein